jgi:hypothetical protein
MKLQLFQELLELNRAFDQVLRGLERMEKLSFFHGEELRYARSEVESARVHSNREFFNSFDEIVEKDAVWAYKFRREYNRKLKDPDDIYLEIKDSEERRQKKGLPPRIVLLPGWGMSDEERYDAEQAKKRKRAARKRKNKITRRRRTSTKRPSTGEGNIRPAPERKTEP